jgi:hypothetical protein
MLDGRIGLVGLIRFVGLLVASLCPRGVMPGLIGHPDIAPNLFYSGLNDRIVTR